MSFRDQWTDEHGVDGLHGKFAVYKRALRADRGYGVDAFTSADRIGEDGEFVFVLRPHSDQAAYEALLQYAYRVASRAPQLAEDIRAQLAQVRLAQVPSPLCSAGCMPGGACRVNPCPALAALAARRA